MTNQNKNETGPAGSQKNWMLWGGSGIVVIAVAVVMFVTLSSGSSGTSDEALLMSGGSLIGQEDAIVKLVEFGDFQ